MTKEQPDRHWCLTHQRVVGPWGHFIAAVCPNDPACDVVNRDEVRRLRLMVESLQQKAVESYDMRQALLRIASEDYRGNMPTHVSLARKALKEAGR